MEGLTPGGILEHTWTADGPLGIELHHVAARSQVEVSKVLSTHLRQLPQWLKAGLVLRRVAGVSVQGLSLSDVRSRIRKREGAITIAFTKAAATQSVTPEAEARILARMPEGYSPRSLSPRNGQPSPQRVPEQPDAAAGSVDAGETHHSKDEADHSKPDTNHSNPDANHSKPDTNHSKRSADHSKTKTDHSKALWAIFKLFDLDGSGTIESDELMR